MTLGLRVDRGTAQMHAVVRLLYSRLVAEVRRKTAEALTDGDGAVHPVDDTPELNNRAVASTLNNPAVVHRYGRIDQVARSAAARESVLYLQLQAASTRRHAKPESLRVSGSLTALARWLHSHLGGRWTQRVQALAHPRCVLG
jgi:hypothetical protein